VAGVSQYTTQTLYTTNLSLHIFNSVPALFYWRW